MALSLPSGHGGSTTSQGVFFFVQVHSILIIKKCPPPGPLALTRSPAMQSLDASLEGHALSIAVGTVGGRRRPAAERAHDAHGLCLQTQ